MLVFILIADEGHIPLVIAADPFRGLLKNYAGFYNYNAIHVYVVLLNANFLKTSALRRLFWHAKNCVKTS